MQEEYHGDPSIEVIDLKGVYSIPKIQEEDYVKCIKYVWNAVKTIYDNRTNLTVSIEFNSPEIDRLADKRKHTIGVFLDTEFNTLSINAT